MNKLHDDLVKLANKINLRWYMVLPIYWILLKCLYWFDIWTCLNGQVNSSTLDSIWVLSSVMCFWGLVFSVLWSRSLADKGKAHTRAGRNFHPVRQLDAPPRPNQIVEHAALGYLHCCYHRCQTVACAPNVN